VNQPAAAREDAGRQGAAWLHDFIVRLVDKPRSVAVDPRWEAPAALILIVRARGRDEAGWLIGRRGQVVEHLRRLAQRVSLGLGLRVAIEVIEA